MPGVNLNLSGVPYIQGKIAMIDTEPMTDKSKRLSKICENTIIPMTEKINRLSEVCAKTFAKALHPFKIAQEVTKPLKEFSEKIKPIIDIIDGFHAIMAIQERSVECLGSRLLKGFVGFDKVYLGRFQANVYSVPVFPDNFKS